MKTHNILKKLILLLCILQMPHSYAQINPDANRFAVYIVSSNNDSIALVSDTGIFRIEGLDSSDVLAPSNCDFITKAKGSNQYALKINGFNGQNTDSSFYKNGALYHVTYDIPIYARTSPETLYTNRNSNITSVAFRFWYQPNYTSAQLTPSQKPNIDSTNIDSPWNPSGFGAVSIYVRITTLDASYLGVETHTGVDSNSKTPNINVFPNPARDLVIIESQSQVEQVKVFNLNGQQLLEFFNCTEINIDSLQTGIYFVEIKTRNGSNPVFVKISKE